MYKNDSEINHGDKGKIFFFIIEKYFFAKKNGDNRVKEESISRYSKFTSIILWIEREMK